MRLLQQYKRRLGLFLRVIFRSADTVVDLSRKIDRTRSKPTILMEKPHALRKPLEWLLFQIDSQSRFVNADANKQCSVIMRRFCKHAAGPFSGLGYGKGFPVEHVTGKQAPQGDIHGSYQSMQRALAKFPGRAALIVESGQVLVARSSSVKISMMGNAERCEEFARGNWRNLEDGAYGVFSGQISRDIVGWQQRRCLFGVVVDRFNAA